MWKSLYNGQISHLNHATFNRLKLNNMKNLILALLIAIGTIYTLPAQILEDTRVMNAGSQPALTLVLPGAETKFVD
jgi:hypothetical protein